MPDKTGTPHRTGNSIGGRLARRAAARLHREAKKLLTEGSAESKRSALEYFGRALTLYRSAGDAEGEATALSFVAFVSFELGDWTRALEGFAQALPIIRATGDLGAESTTLNSMAFVYDALGEKGKAVDHYNQSLELARRAEDRPGEARALNNLGMAHYGMGENHEALNYFEQALSWGRVLKDPNVEARALINMGLVYDSLGLKAKALNFYNDALLRVRALGDRSAEATTLNNIGLLYQSQGEREESLRHYSQALLIARAIGDRRGEATTLTNIGSAHNFQGESQQALDNYMQALALLRALGDRRVAAYALNNIGTIYDFLNQQQQALDCTSEALDIFRAIGDQQGEAAALNIIGELYYAQGEFQKAFDCYSLALPLVHDAGNRDGEAATLNHLALLYGLKGEDREALDAYMKALTLSRASGNRAAQATVLSNLGGAYNKLGEHEKALAYYEEALALHTPLLNPPGKAALLFNISFNRQLQGDLPEARIQIERALVILESLREKIGASDLRSSYFAKAQDYYALHIEVLMRMHLQDPSAGLHREALRTVERARARVLLETLTEAAANIRQNVDLTLLERERSLRRQLNGLARLLNQTTWLDPAETETRSVKLEREIEALTLQLQQVEVAIRQQSPNYAALIQPQPLSVEEMQAEVLDADTLLLEYSLGENKSYLWAVTPTSIDSYELPGASEIEAVAREASRLLNVRNESIKRKQIEQADADYAVVGARLSQMVLAPAAALLAGKRLLIVSDGALQYIPFGALPVPAEQDGCYKASDTGAQPAPTPGNRPLVLDHEIVSVPSASTIAVLRRELANRPPAEKTLAVFADPVFDSKDERLKSVRKKGEGAESRIWPWAKGSKTATNSAPPTIESDLDATFGRLRGTRVEAAQILSLVPADQSMKAFDFNASLKLVSSPELAHYRYVHFATHGILDSVHPELSGVVLSLVDEDGTPQDGFLRAHEVFNLKLNADLVTLSACETGLGKEVKGEGLIGLTRGFMYAGAPRVVVSLWSVSDYSTAELMTRFYRGMLQEGLQPSAALRAAQISLLKEPQWSAPFYWAAFILQGEWR